MRDYFANMTIDIRSALRYLLRTWPFLILSALLGGLLLMLVKGSATVTYVLEDKTAVESYIWHLYDQEVLQLECDAAIRDCASVLASETATEEEKAAAQQTILDWNQVMKSVGAAVYSEFECMSELEQRYASSFKEGLEAEGYTLDRSGFASLTREQAQIRIDEKLTSDISATANKQARTSLLKKGAVAGLGLAIVILVLWYLVAPVVKSGEDARYLAGPGAHVIVAQRPLYPFSQRIEVPNVKAMAKELGCSEEEMTEHIAEAITVKPGLTFGAELKRIHKQNVENDLVCDCWILYVE